MNNPVKFEAQKIRNFQKIKFKGKINNKNLIYLYGLSDNGEPGFNIIKEVDIEGENFLINQGWIPRDLKGNSFDLKQSEYFGITKLKSSKNYFKPNNDLIKKVLNWSYQMSLKDGLTETYKWIEEQINSGSNIDKFCRSKIEDK